MHNERQSSPTISDSNANEKPTGGLMHRWVTRLVRSFSSVWLPAACLTSVMVLWFVYSENRSFPLIFTALTSLGLLLRWVRGVWRVAKLGCYRYELLSPNAPSGLLLDLCHTRNPVRRVIESVAVRHAGLAGRRHLLQTHQHAGNDPVLVNGLCIACGEPIE